MRFYKVPITMNIEQALHMNGGEGETSYAQNSLPQRSVILKTEPLIKSALSEFFSTNKPPEFLGIADLACSSGPNSLLPTSLILNAARERCQLSSLTLPDFQVFLNDLPGNDFNTIANSIPSYYEKLKKHNGEVSCLCFISMTAGSFHKRLFPGKILHFVYCANSLHWLSQIPPRIESELQHFNKGEIAFGKTSHQAIFEEYFQQFKNDFTSFLKSRSQEIVPGGQMILALVIRKRTDPFAIENYSVWDDLSSTLRDFIASGIVQQEKLESFNLPYYEPHKEELKEIIESEGSFEIFNLLEEEEGSRLDSDEFCKTINHKIQANCFRAVIEPMLSSHFGESLMDRLFEKYEEKLSEREIHMVTVLFASLMRKT